MSEIKVKTFKFKGRESIELAALFKMFNENRVAENLAKKNKDAAREMLLRKLKELRDLDVEKLPEGDSAIIQCEQISARIDRKGKDLFDIKSFRAEFPDLADKFNKRPVASYIELIN